jgi:hypothetical protein
MDMRDERDLRDKRGLLFADSCWLSTHNKSAFGNQSRFSRAVQQDVTGYKSDFPPSC